MFGIVSLGWWLMRSPLVWLWYAYRGLWWAFADAPATVPNTAAVGQDTSFQVVDSRTARVNLPRPDGLLRVGFVASATLSVIIAAILLVAGGHGMQANHALMVWTWLTLLVVVLSQFWVRHVALSRHANRSAWSSARDSVTKAARAGGGAAVGAASTVVRTLKNLGNAAKRYHEQRKQSATPRS